MSAWDGVEAATEHAAQDAADALVALGWPVKPPSCSQPRWRIGEDLLTATELLVFASFVVIVPRTRRPGQ